MSGKSKPRLGDLLVQAGIITPQQLQDVLSQQKGRGKRLGQILLEDGYVTQEELTRVLEEQLGIERINLKQVGVDSQAARLIPENLARRHTVVPVRVEKGSLLLAMEDPLDQVALQDIRLLVGRPVKALLASRADIVFIIDRVFGQLSAVKAADDLNLSRAGVAEAVEDVDLDVDSAPVVRMVKSILEDAVRNSASDIHIEPDQDQMRVRTRMDGILHETLLTVIGTHAAVASRIKVMAGLDISEKRVPQDGRAMITVDRRAIDLRVSTMPTTYGEKVVIRILDRESYMVGKEKLGLSPEGVEIFDRLLSKPFGIILVTGPTGSGKTTTLYTMLSELNDSRKNIITLEDPVEYDMKGINQTQINVRAGLTFATGLRSVLRQDPDVLMVGEIRDRETAEIATRAALTGHLVLSTLHTNDAPGAVARLIDMGVPRYLVSATVIGVMAQRLVRTICPQCKREYPARETEKRLLDYSPEDSLTLTAGRGCNYCNQFGYKGRTGVFEIMEMLDEHRLLVDKGCTPEELRLEALRLGMVPLREDARRKVLNGITTVEEMIRVT